MPFDSLTMAAVRDEVSQSLVGGQIQRIIQPSLHSVGISIYSGGRAHWLAISVDARYARVSMQSGKLAKAFPTPSAFVMLLRKYLESGRLTEVNQIRYERILHLTCRTRSELYVLAVEIMGKHSNAILLDANNMVLGAIKVVSTRQSRVRPILPGRAYQPPPPHDRDTRLFGPGPRIDPLVEEAQFETALREAPPHTSVGAVLEGLLPGAGAFLCDQVARRVGVDATATLATIEPASLMHTVRDLYSLVDTHRWRPTTFRNARGRADYAPFEPVGVVDVQPADTMSEAIERATQGDESRDVLASLRQTVIEDIEHARKAAEGRIHSLQAGLESSKEADAVMERGQLVLAYGYGLPKHATVLEIPDLNARIALDPLLSTTENAEKLFRRYRKLKAAQHRIPPMIEETERELDRLADLKAFAVLATAESDLYALQNEIRLPVGDGVKASGTRKRKGPPQYRLDSWIAIAGRSARENEEVTFKLARRDDLWLHAAGWTGAHVVVRGGAKDSPPEMLSAAAGLAAYLSSARNDSAVDVVAAAVGDVRKVSGGPPGKVTYRNARTIRVAPDPTPWTRVGG